MYIDTIDYQLKEFLYSFSFGFILGTVYDLVRIIRIALYNKKNKIYIWDILYSLVAAFLTVLFLLSVCDGKLQFYLFFSIALGFLIYYLTLGEIVRRIFIKIIFCCKTVFKKYIFVILKKIIAVFRKFNKKSKNNSEKLLQVDDNMMYNKTNNHNNGEEEGK